MKRRCELTGRDKHARRSHWLFEARTLLDPIAGEILGVQEVAPLADPAFDRIEFKAQAFFYSLSIWIRKRIWGRRRIIKA
jgi:hypothetical protein